MCVSEVCCHRRGASRDFERSRFTSRDHSGVPVAQRHWQSVESAAFRSWPFKIPSARVDQLHVSFFSKLFIFQQPPYDPHGARRHLGYAANKLVLYFYPRGDVETFMV